MENVVDNNVVDVSRNNDNITPIFKSAHKHKSRKDHQYVPINRINFWLEHPWTITDQLATREMLQLKISGMLQRFVLHYPEHVVYPLIKRVVDDAREDIISENAARLFLVTDKNRGYGSLWSFMKNKMYNYPPALKDPGYRMVTVELPKKKPVRWY